jgi:hypothetical protein
MRPRRGRSNRSGAAEADGDFPGLDDDGDVALAVGESEHALEPSVVAEHVDVFEGDLALAIGLTGLARVGSEVLPEDENFIHSCTI